MAKHPSWSGTLKLSLVSCPVQMFSTSTGEGTASFHLINPKTRSRVRMQPVDAGTGEPLQRSDLVKGYEFDNGRYAIVTDDELKRIRLHSSKTIEVEQFVDAGEIDSLYLDATYYLVPDGEEAGEAFGVIREAMRRQKKVAIGRLVMSYRERLVAISPRDDIMLLTRLRDAREIGPLPVKIGHVKVDPEMVGVATQIINQRLGKFAPTRFKDSYETALRAMLKRRQHGAKPLREEEPEEQAPTNVIDLMSALKSSLGRRGRRTATTDDDDRKVVRWRKRPPHRAAKPGSKKRAPHRRHA